MSTDPLSVWGRLWRCSLIVLVPSVLVSMAMEVIRPGVTVSLMVGMTVGAFSGTAAVLYWVWRSPL